jgi:hypothetical protein
MGLRTRWWRQVLTYFWLTVFIRRIRKIAKSCDYPRYVCPSVLVEHLCSYLDKFSWNLVLEDFSKVCREHSNSIKIWQWRVHCIKDPWIFLKIDSWVLRMRNVSEEKLLRKSKHTFYVQKPFPEIRVLYELMWKIWYMQTGHTWQYNTAHALCMLDN